MDNVLFSKEECEYIKSFWDEFNSIDGSTRVEVKKGDGSFVYIRRNSKAKFLDLYNKELINFLLSRLSKIDIKSILINGVKITKYSEGDFFGLHRDYKSDKNGVVYKTLVIQLSDESTYIGGDLCVKEIPQSRKQGSYSLFLSSDIHEVKLIESGSRFSLTIFLCESDFSSAKSKLL